MQLWTTFSPQKISWELTTIQEHGKSGSSNWMANQSIIVNSLALLKKAGITGIRLVIFPSELTEGGQSFDWKPIDTMLDLCKKQRLLVDLCIGPYQYPYYPGIYLPLVILNLFQNPIHLRSRNEFGMTPANYLDALPELREYGLHFLHLQLERYGSDPRIHGFHLANEWPDKQAVSGQEQTKLTVSHAFMLEAIQQIKKATVKLISLNTNIDASFHSQLFKTFNKIFALLGSQGKLGLDIYPSQETWKKAPLQKIQRLTERYTTSVAWCANKFYPSEIYFAEVEAQPWGNGQSWYSLITAEPNPEEKVLTYTRASLQKTWDKYIADTPCTTVSLWGSDFWLSAHEMGITWPLHSLLSLNSTETTSGPNLPSV